MGILARLFGKGNSMPSRDFKVVRVRCAKCGEEVRSMINLKNDLSPLEDGEGFFINKVLIGGGDNLCFQHIEIRLEFDAARNLKGRQISGGQFIEGGD